MDDNDPRLLFLVTYNEQSNTTYMKIVKIENQEKENNTFTQSFATLEN